MHSVAYRLLTDRQAEFVRLTCAGRSLREVAAAVGVEVVTVRALLYSVRTRLKTHPSRQRGRDLRYSLTNLRRGLPW